MQNVAELERQWRNGRGASLPTSDKFESEEIVRNFEEVSCVRHICQQVLSKTPVLLPVSLSSCRKLFGVQFTTNHKSHKTWQVITVLTHMHKTQLHLTDHRIITVWLPPAPPLPRLKLFSWADLSTSHTLVRESESTVAILMDSIWTQSYTRFFIRYE